MKKIGLILVIVIGIFSFCFLNFKIKDDTYTEYLRIHIRANSNSIEDQNVKYKVKDEIVEALIPVLSEVETFEEAKSVISNNFSLITSVADNVLKQEGFNYSSRAKIDNEYFPTRTYANTTLESGYYDAVIVELGEAVGDNWWCVMYPPLCFITNGNQTEITFKSKIVEWFKSIFD